MANSKLIVIEGAQGAGKTTITDYLRHTLKYTNLYRLCGTSDSSPTGLKKATDMYNNLLDYITSMENESINLLFDRTFFSEENYSRLGFKEYSFSESYNKLLERFSKLDFDIYYITVYLRNTLLYEDRILRKDKAVPEYAKFKVDSSINQQKVYLEMAEEIKEKYSNIKCMELSTDEDFELTKQKLKDFIGF